MFLCPADRTYAETPTTPTTTKTVGFYVLQIGPMRKRPSATSTRSGSRRFLCPADRTYAETSNNSNNNSNNNRRFYVLQIGPMRKRAKNRDEDLKRCGFYVLQIGPMRKHDQ